MQKLTFLERLIAHLKGGDESKLARFDSKLRKYFSKQISIRQDQIEKLREKISDADEELGDAVLQVDPSNIGTTDSTDSYVSKYVRNVSEKLTKTEDLEQQIKDVEEEVVRLEKMRTIIYPDEPATT